MSSAGKLQWPGARRRLAAMIIVVASWVVAWSSAEPTEAQAACDRVAALSGSDSGAGTEASPYRTAQELSDSLSAGQVGCLRDGIYNENVKVTKGGISGSPVTITSYPGERATVVGRLWVTDSANYVTFADLNLNGRNASNLPSPNVNGDGVAFLRNDVSNDHTTICFDLGSSTWGRAYATVIDGNRIHDCGALPPTNYDHGVYVAVATGTSIQHNEIYDNANRGVQLYPDSQGSYVAHNVIDGNGEGVLFAGDSTRASSNNVVEYNMITFSTVRNNVEYYWPGPIGSGNVLRRNCVYGGAYDNGDGGISSAVGFSALDNVIADPQYVDRAGHDYSLQSTSPCLNLESGGSGTGSGGGGTSGGGDTTTKPPRKSKSPHGRKGKTARFRRVRLSSRRRVVAKHRKLRLRGRVRGNLTVPARVLIRVRGERRWRTLSTTRTNVRGRFAVTLRVRSLQRPQFLRGGHGVQLRALVRGLGRSAALRMRVL